ncbi:hypothetical protein DIPPA_31626 [Diplonema papillatum]|nr:hypothetical protein DIPPA_31626 [Diplonema papillatum]
MPKSVSVVLVALLVGTCLGSGFDDDGMLLTRHGEDMYCSAEDCVLANEAATVVVHEGGVEVRVGYDAGGPFLAVNTTVVGDNTEGSRSKHFRYTFAITYLGEDEANGAAITYLGDSGYDLCCRFLHDVPCSWLNGTHLVPVGSNPGDGCTFASFSGSVRKPLPHHKPGPWEAALKLYTAPANSSDPILLSPLGSVFVPFNIGLVHLSKMVALQEKFNRPGPRELPSSE